jgi:4-hydroxythreonine-4-phosphate dehydrogenase
MTEFKPRILITLGDPKGIGPEVIAKALGDPTVAARARFELVGNEALFERACELTGTEARFAKISKIDLPEGPSAEQRGKYVYDALCSAVEICLQGQADGLVTGPLEKAALWDAGHCVPGHTEILGRLCDAAPVMMLAGGPLRVVPLTTHVALREVPDQLSCELVYDIALTVARSLKLDFGLDDPKLALTGLNPHAGEGGCYGNEEKTILEPAAEKLKAQGVRIDGPLPADTAFYKAAQGEYDAVLSPTHDQALIPVKLLAFRSCVNITCGLPIVRTSPGHGTAFDIAWQGVADAGAMIAAIETAVLIAQKRRK